MCPCLQRDMYEGIAVHLHSFQNMANDVDKGLSSGTSRFTPGWSPEAFWAVWKREYSAENRTTILDHPFLIWVTTLTELSGSQDTKSTSEGFANSASLKNQRNYTENVIQPEMRFPFDG